MKNHFSPRSETLFAFIASKLLFWSQFLRFTRTHHFLLQIFLYLFKEGLRVDFDWIERGGFHDLLCFWQSLVMAFDVDFKSGPMEELFLAIIAFKSWCFSDYRRVYLEFNCSSSELWSGCVPSWCSGKLVRVRKSLQSYDLRVGWKRAGFLDWG